MTSFMWSRDVIGHVNIQLGIADFLYDLNGNQTRISLCFRELASDITVFFRRILRVIKLHTCLDWSD